jgi:replicative DNA helicase
MAGPVTLKNYFGKEGDLVHVDGMEYLAELASSAIMIINAEDEGHTIDDLYMRRELIVLGRISYVMRMSPGWSRTTVPWRKPRHNFVSVSGE